MSSIYFIRHGQAGTREDYDRLSSVGQEQARRLGRYLAAEGVRFSRFYAGELVRHRETAACVIEAFPGTQIDIDPRWNEFDLDAVYQGIAPQLAAEDAEFQQHWGSLKDALAGGDQTIHRRWTRADTSVVRAWVMGRYSYAGESWEHFVARVGDALRALPALRPDEAVAISTSATPAAISIGLALELNSRQMMRLAGATYNSAFSVLRLRGEDLSLSSFNAVPHLAEAHLRTYR